MQGDKKLEGLIAREFNVNGAVQIGIYPNRAWEGVAIREGTRVSVRELVPTSFESIEIRVGTRLERELFH